ncbi:MAG: glycosyltransferase [Muribaculum sp.]|nr:glycosyltransferase [Muribaculum sp.]
MNNPESDIKVSVIVATYNQEETVGRTINSILAQKCDFPFEIVIGEDCSSDSTLEVCRQYAERFPDKVRVFANTANKGLRDNYYDCLLQCRGRYIADCAGDDYWIDSLKLQKQADLLDQNPEVNLVHTDWEYVDADSGLTRPSNPDGTKDRFRLVKVHGAELILPILRHEASPIIHLCTAMYRKAEIMEAYHADTFLFRHPDFPCEDLQLIISLAAGAYIAFIPDVTLRYSVGAETVSASLNPKKAFDFYAGVLELTLYLAEKYGHNVSEIEKYTSRTLEFILAQAFNSADSDRRRRFIEIVQKWHLQLSAKCRLTLLLSSWEPLWKVAASVNRLKSTF